MNTSRDLQGIRRVIEQTVPDLLKPGTVIARLPKSVKVRITGSNITVEAAVLRGAKVQVGDEVVLFRIEGQRRWTVFGAMQAGTGTTSSADVADYTGVLAPPSQFRVYNGWGFIIAMWDTPAQNTAISFQVQIADNVTGEEENAEYHIVSGHNFLSVQDPGVSKKLRVRSVDEQGGKSGWTAWLVATAQTVFFNTGTAANLPLAAEAHEGEPYYAYDTHTLYICHNEAWEMVLGTGSVAPVEGPGYWDVDAEPETPGLYDNEFASGWSEFAEFDPHSRLSVSMVNSTLNLAQSTGYTPIWPGLWRQMPTTPWTLVVKARVAPLEDDLADCFWFGFGLAVREYEQDNDDLLTRVLFLQQTSLLDGSPNRKVTLWHDQGLHAQGYGSTYDNTNVSIATDSWVYFRLRYAGQVLGIYPIWFEVSLDGETWESKKVQFASPPIYIGMVTDNFDVQGNPTFVTGLVDFFRYIPECVDSDAPVSGGWISTALTSAANLMGDVVPFDYTTASPLALGNVDTGEHVHVCKVLIDIPFNDTASLTVGEPGAVERLMPASLVDLAEAGQYVNTPEYTYPGPTSLHLYLSTTGCTQGAGRIILTRKESYRG